ncbi:vesicle transport protein [Babesia ovis]|uniref:Vesicle transport protein n=1 Tax=Babesia ovis TaxID=5869 RepID=A0A9W5TBV6_BABOV|nr:vesicle transport protein [Babesia ovis]
MGDLFEEYHHHVTKLLDNVAEQLKSCEQGSLGSLATRRQNLEQLKKTINSAEETVRQLELEAHASNKDIAATRINEIARIKSTLKNASNRSHALENELQHSELVGGIGDIHSGGHYSQLSENDKLIQKGYEYLQTSCAMAQETEMIGVGAEGELYEQRNALYRIQSDVGNVRFSIKEADEYLTQLFRQGRLNAFVLRAVFVSIGIAAVIIIVSRLLRWFL